MGLKFNLRLEVDLEYPCPEGFKNCGNSGTRVNINYYINTLLESTDQNEVFEYFTESETDDIEAAYREFDGVYTEEELRLIRIRFMSEMAN